MSPQPVLLPRAGEGAETKSRRMRDGSAWATLGDVSLVASIPHPTSANAEATFSRKREKVQLRDVLMILHRPPKQLARARAMRGTPTKAEDILWRSLRCVALGVKFRRQVPIGPYIADFACLPAKLVIELDGPPHDEPTQQKMDRQRDAWFTEHGWRVLRIPNEIVFGGGDIVIDRIKAALHEIPSSDPALPGHLLPQAGEGRDERNN